MNIAIKLREDVARALQTDQPNVEASELRRIAAEVGVSLRPTHPGAEDPLLAPYFQIEVPDESKAQEVIEALRRSSAVEGAYLKPRDELP